LRFLKSDVIKEFPDLENDEEWRKKGIERLKEHFKNIETEKQKAFYVKNELTKFGNELIFVQRAGHRQKKKIEQAYFEVQKNL
jgi:hypothetical protein